MEQSGIVNVKSFGASGDGLKDDTKAIQDAISAMPKDGGVLLFPKGVYIQGDGTNPSYRIDEETGEYVTDQEADIGKDIRLFLSRYRNFLIIGYGAIIKAHPNNSNIQNNAGFFLDGCTNGVIEGLTYDGSIETRKPSGRDHWKFNKQSGMRVDGSKNIIMRDLIFDNCVMDGFTISGKSENVRIYNCKSRYCYRQGLSLASANRVGLYDCEFSNIGKIYGTPPMAGVDIEPDNSDNECLQEIVIENLRTQNNVCGIQVYTENIANLTNPISITIRNHKDIGSEYGFKAIRYIPKVNGLIKLENCEWESINPFNVSDWSSTGVRVEAHDCRAILSSSIGNISTAFNISKGDYTDEPDKVLGNVHLYRVSTMSKDANAELPERNIFLDDSYAGSIENIKIINPINTPATIAQIYANSAMEDILIEDDFKKLKTSLATGVLNVSADDYKRYYDNEGASSDVYFYIVTNSLVGKTITFTNKAGSLLVFSQTRGLMNPIFPSVNAVGFSSQEKGATITLQCKKDGYYILKEIGNWTEITS